MDDPTATDPNVPLLAGATTDGHWNSYDHDGVLTGCLEWARFDTGKIGVGIDGWHRATGEITRGISFYGVPEGEPLTAVQARDLAAALTQAADEPDRLDHRAGA